MRCKRKVKKHTEKLEVNFKNKIIILILSILLLICCSILGYFYFVYISLKDDNNVIRKEIANIKNEIISMDYDYINYTDELNKKKTELKDKIEEYNIWLETIEKVK